MRPEGVRKAMRAPEGYFREICTNDGARIRVTTDDHWATGDEFMAVFDDRGVYHLLDYRNITSIRHIPKNGNGRRKK